MTEYIPTGVESKIDKDAKIIVACSSGGTMKPTQNLPEGQQSRYGTLESNFLSLYTLSNFRVNAYISLTFYKHHSSFD